MLVTFRRNGFIKSKCSEDYSTVDKKGHEKLIATGKILFRVGSHVASKAKSSKAREFKFPSIKESMFYGRFTLLYV